MIAIMSSVPEEGKLLIRKLKKKSPVGGKAVYRGRIDGTNVVYMIGGMGKTNAAHAATVLMENFSPEIVMAFGIGGAFPNTGLKVGDIAVAEKEIYGDEGVWDREGYHDTEFIGIPLLKKGRKSYFNVFELDRKLVGKTLNSLALCPMPPAEIRSGAFVTVSTCTGTKRRAMQLGNQFGAVCENMEGASVAHVCAIYGRQLIEIRGISNIIEDRDPGKWNVKRAAENCQRAVIEVLKVL